MWPRRRYDFRICNVAGTVLDLMPRHELYILLRQHCARLIKYLKKERGEASSWQICESREAIMKSMSILGETMLRVIIVILLLAHLPWLSSPIFKR